MFDHFTGMPCTCAMAWVHAAGPPGKYADQGLHPAVCSGLPLCWTIMHLDMVCVPDACCTGLPAWLGLVLLLLGVPDGGHCGRCNMPMNGLPGCGL
jgi:hypothetical protein